MYNCIGRSFTLRKKTSRWFIIIFYTRIEGTTQISGFPHKLDTRTNKGKKGGGWWGEVN